MSMEYGEHRCSVCRFGFRSPGKDSRFVCSDCKRTALTAFRVSPDEREGWKRAGK